MTNGLLVRKEEVPVEVEEEGILPVPSKEEEQAGPAAKISAASQRSKEIRGILSPTATTVETQPLIVDVDTSSSSLVNVETVPSFDYAPKVEVPVELSSLVMEQVEPPKLPGSVDPSPGEFDEADVLQFLFGPEMAILGISYDNEGWHQSWEAAKQQWSEAPVWSNLLSSVSLLGSTAFPAASAVFNTAKFGRVAGLLGKLPAEADEIRNFKTLGLLEKDVSSLNYNQKYKLRKMAYNMDRYNQRQNRLIKASRGEAPANAMDQLLESFDSQFRNTYADGLGDVVNRPQFTKELNERLNNAFNTYKIGALLQSAPPEEMGADIIKYLYNKSKPGLVPAVKLDPTTQKWADNLFTHLKMHSDDTIKSGWMSPQEVEHVGGIHIPALGKETPEVDLSKTRTFLLRTGEKRTKITGIKTTEEPRKGVLGALGFKKVVAEPLEGEAYIGVKLQPFPRLDSPTLLERKTSLPEVLRKLAADEYITDPADLTVRGYLTDALLHENAKMVRDIVTHPEYGFRHADIVAKFPKQKDWEKAGFMSLEKLQLPGVKNRLRRMINMKGFNLADDEPLPMIRREVFDEIFGSEGSYMQIQSAVDAVDMATTIHKTMKTTLSPKTQFINGVGNMGMISMGGYHPFSPEMIDLYHQSGRSFQALAEVASTARKSGIKTRNLFDPQTGLLKAANLGKIKAGEKTFDVAEELADKSVQDLLEQSAFEMAEGGVHIEDLMMKMPKSTFSGKIGRAMGKAYLGGKYYAQAGNRLKWIDGAAKAYLGADMIPKMALYFKLRGDGLTKAAAVYEVGRRLPMYATTGKAITGLRKNLLPWGTFPAEALRITKNNLMDHPLRMMPWLRLPQIMQSFMAGMEVGPTSAAEAAEAKAGLPTYAQSPATVTATGETIATLGGAATGAGIAGVAGGLLAGPAGAYIGGAVGGAIGGAIGNRLTTPEDGDAVRGAILDWLPFTSFMPQTTYPHFNTIQDVMNVVPGAPLGILQPLINVMTGRTMFGTEIQAESLSDKMIKSIGGLIGWLSPPLLQKYFFREGTPDISLLEATIGKEVNFDPTRFTNVQKALIDFGGNIDPSTLKPSSLTHDAFLNNLSVRSYLSDPAQALRNEVVQEEALGATRSYLTRNLRFYAVNEMNGPMKQVLAQVMATFAQQYANDPAMAQKKFTDWVKNQTQDIKRHPKLRGMSEEELLRRLNDASNYAAEARFETRQQMMDFIRTELNSRRGMTLQSDYWQSSLKRLKERGIIGTGEEFEKSLKKLEKQGLL